MKTENWDLETQLVDLKNQLANLEKQLEIARLDKRPTLLSPPLLPSLIFNDSDGNSKHFHYYSRKAKLTKLPDPPILTDSHMAGFDINVWESKMAKKLSANADYYPTKALYIAYVNSCMDKEAYKHLVARSRIGARKPFATVEEMFEVLQKAYGDVNQKHTAMNKFRDLKMTKDFNNFWMEFQVLASELDHNKATFINELKFKLIPLLFQAMAGGVSRLTDIHEYVK